MKDEHRRLASSMLVGSVVALIMLVACFNELRMRSYVNSHAPSEDREHLLRKLQEIDHRLKGVESLMNETRDDIKLSLGC